MRTRILGLCFRDRRHRPPMCSYNIGSHGLATSGFVLFRETVGQMVTLELSVPAFSRVVPVTAEFVWGLL